MESNEYDAFQTAVLSCMLLFFSICAWLIPFAAINEEATLKLLSPSGETWFVGFGLLLWFAFGAYCVTRAEANTDDSKITAQMYFKKLVLVPFAPLLVS
jgi:hypothetical protein